MPHATSKDILFYYHDNRHDLKHHPFHLIQADRVACPVIELGRPWRLVRGHYLRLLENSAVCEIDRDPGRPEGVAANLRCDPGYLCPPLNHVKGIGAHERPLGELPRPPEGASEKRPLFSIPAARM